MRPGRPRLKPAALSALTLMLLASGLPDMRAYALSGIADIDITIPVNPVHPVITTPIIGANQPAPLRWKLILGDYLGTPAVGKDGMIYAAVHNGPSNSGDRDSIAAVTPYGVMKWSWQPPKDASAGPLTGTPSIGPDGSIYVRTAQRLFAIDPNGRTKWTFAEQYPAAAAFGADGTVYVGDNSSILYALSPNDGKVKWDYAGQSLFSAVAGPDGAVYGLEYDGAAGRSVLALDSAGAKKWSYVLGTKDLGSIGIAPDGSVLAFTAGKLTALKPSGALKWEFGEARPYEDFAPSGDGGAYLKGWVSNAAPHSRVLAVSADGKKKWEWSVDASDPAVNGAAATDVKLHLGGGANGMFYASEYNILYAVSSAGKKLWKYADPDKRELQSPVAGPDGTVIVVGKSGYGAAVANSALLAIGTTPAAGVKLDQSSLSLAAGKSAALRATVSPAGAVEKAVRWRSSNPAVAEVDGSGQVTGRSPGTAVITATTVEGEYAAACTITVTPGTASPSAPAASVPFADIAGHWASADIVKAYEAGVTKGYTDGTFKPDAGITRAEFAVMLMKGLKQTGVVQALAFKDAGSIPAWAAPSVAAAVKLGIISGYGDGTFKPQADITHAEMIAMVVKASGLPTDPAAATGYADDASVPAWARGAAAVAGKHMLLGGLQGNRFQPGAKATRAEAAAAIMRMLAAK